jgi:hypothetical protein
MTADNFLWAVTVNAECIGNGLQSVEDLVLLDKWRHRLPAAWMERAIEIRAAAYRSLVPTGARA